MIQRTGSTATHGEPTAQSFALLMRDSWQFSDDVASDLIQAAQKILRSKCCMLAVCSIAYAYIAAGVAAG
jgi:hypothetical protein